MITETAPPPAIAADCRDGKNFERGESGPNFGWCAAHKQFVSSGGACSKAVRTVKTCMGPEFGRFGLDDAIGTGVEPEREREGLHTPHKVKASVSGLSRNRAEASTKQIGLIAVDGGWQVRIGGAAGASVRKGDVLASVEAGTEAMRIATTFLKNYREIGGVAQ